MIGVQSISMMIYVFGLLPLMYVITGPIPDLPRVMIFVSIFMTMSSLIWINYLISYNRLQPLINRIRPENEIVWVRITKDKLLTFHVAKKGVYGQTKGVMHRKKADVIDKGDYPISLINGNRAIFVSDRSSHNINVDNAVAWKQLFKKYKVKSGRDAYLKSERVHTND